MNKGVAASELLMHLGRGDEENNNMEVAKKRTTLTENSAGGNGMKTLGGIQGVGNCRPARFSAKKSVGWYLEVNMNSKKSRSRRASSSSSARTASWAFPHPTNFEGTFQLLCTF